jgi:hypothetical protein
MITLFQGREHMAAEDKNLDDLSLFIYTHRQVFQNKRIESWS